MAPSSPDERESLSGGEASGGGYGAAPSTRGSFNVGMDPDVGYCEATEEDERQARLLRRGLALDVAPQDMNTFVKLEGPDDVAVVVPHTLHFGDVEHLDYTATVHDALAVQTAGSPMHRPDRFGKAGGVGTGDFGGSDSSAHAHAAAVPRKAISGWLVWLAIMLTGLGTGLVSVVLVNISVGFGNTRLQQANELLELNRPLAAGAVWVTFSLVFCTIAAFITVYYAPQAASTGIPETKAFLNGCDVKGAFSLQTFVVKAFGVCLVIAAGAPVGLEGPMVHIGAMVASHVVLSMEHFGVLSGGDVKHLLTHLVTCGVASGISAAFNSPIGGVLFVVEDLAARWLVDAHLVLQCFVSSFFSQLVVAGAHITSLMVQTARSGDRGEFQAANLVKSGGRDGSGAPRVTGGWFVADVPLCILLGAGVGALLSFSTAAATAIARVKRSVMAGASKTGGRRRSAPGLRGEIVAAVFPVAFVSVLAFVLPLLFSCRVRQDHVKGKPEVSHLLAGQHQADHRMFVRFTCQQGEYNDLASLLLPSLSGSFASTMSHLYSRDSDEETYGDASLATLATCYYFFPLFIIGCSFPFGLFVPNLVFGSAAGHLFGRLVNRSAWVGSSRVAHPTTYAVLGAGAALGGWTRMAIAISAIMLEQTGNMDSVILMMVTVLSSRLVAGFLTPHSFTDEVVSMKGYQVLEPREPAIIATLSAGAVCTRDVVCLRADETVAGICRALIHTTHNAFPVCASPPRASPRVSPRADTGGAPEERRVSDEDRSRSRSFVEPDRPVWRVETGGHDPSPELLGLVARSTLLGILERAVNARRPSERDAEQLRVPASALEDAVSLRPADGVVPADELGSIPAHVPASRAYREFALLGARRVVVVESGGGNRLAGVITRGDLVEASEDFEGRAARAAAARRRGRRERGAREYESFGGEGLLARAGPRRSWGAVPDSRASRILPSVVTDER